MLLLFPGACAAATSPSGSGQGCRSRHTSVTLSGTASSSPSTGHQVVLCARFHMHHARRHDNSSLAHAPLEPHILTYAPDQMLCCRNSALVVRTCCLVRCSPRCQNGERAVHRVARSVPRDRCCVCKLADLSHKLFVLQRVALIALVALVAVASAEPVRFAM